MSPTATLGKTHLLLLHFPIALSYAVLFVEVALRRVDEERRRQVTTPLLAIAVGGAVLAAGTGLLLAQSEGMHGGMWSLLGQHRGAGLLTVAIAVLALAAQRAWLPARAYVPLLVLLVASVSFAGHRGGELVHGEGYLFEPPEKPASSLGDDDLVAAASDGDEGPTAERTRRPEGKIPEKPSFAEDIKPILQSSCVKCHGPEKRKGGLRLDKKRFALKGGETGPAIAPGNVGDSLLVTYVSLPPDDDSVMPPKGKLLAQSEIETLKKWIEQGALWPDEDESKPYPTE